MVEVVRSYGAAVVLAPQSFDGMGGPEAASRILNAAHTIFLHAVPDPDPIIKAAGTKMATEWSLQHERGLSHRRRLDRARSTSCASTPTRSGASRPACAS